MGGDSDALVCAEGNLAAALSLFQECGAQPDIATTYAALGQLRIRQGRLTEASQALAKALKMSDKLGMVDEPQRVRRIIQQMSLA